MTIVCLVGGAVLAAVGTRLAAVAFIAAAALAATEPGSLQVVGTWTAALAASLVLLDVVPVRRLALPALGAAAVVAAGSAPNGAVVCGLWVLGTAALVLHRVTDDRWRRSGVVLAALDLLFVAGVATTASGGFQGWPATLGGPGGALLLASAALRVPFAAVPADDRDGAAVRLLIVRTQVVVAVLAAVAAGDTMVGEAAVVAGAAAFGLAPFARSRDVTDTAQELGAFAIVAAGAALGWIAPGWAWGALAAGTLTHQLRFMVGGNAAGQWPDAVLRASGIGLPFLPVVAAILHGASGVRGWRGAVLLVAMVVGLGARSRLPAIARSRRRTTRADVIRTVAVVVLAAAAGLWGGALTLPRPPGASPIDWPPAWAAAVVGVVGAAGSQLVRVVSPTKVSATEPAFDAVTTRLASVPVPAGRKVVWAALAVIALAAAGVWAAGLARGFL